RGPMANKTADAIKLVLRLPKPVHKRLKHEAAQNDVSLNTEIVHRLKESLPTAQHYRDMKALAARSAELGSKQDFTEINEKLDKLIAAVEALEREDDEQK